MQLPTLQPIVHWMVAISRNFPRVPFNNFVKAAAKDRTTQFCIVFSFDGASRGKPRKAAEGNCAWWGTWKENRFNEIGMLMCRGRRIGTQTNNVAEARGLAFAVKAALHFWFWLVESCAQAVETRTL